MSPSAFERGSDAATRRNACGRVRPGLFQVGEDSEPVLVQRVVAIEHWGDAVLQAAHGNINLMSLSGLRESASQSPSMKRKDG